MMIGELDFGNIFIDTIHVNNDKTAAPFESISFCGFCVPLFLFVFADHRAYEPVGKEILFVSNFIK